jgi:hypothetical protein
MIRHRPSGFIAAVAMVAVVAAGCTSRPDGTPIARVGDSVLTLEEARADLDTLSEEYENRLRRYVAGWVNSELLHQEAVRLGLGESAEFREKVDAVGRQLLNQELLDRLVYDRDTVLPPDTLRAYFDKHREEFILTEDHLKLRLMTFRGRESARRFVAAVTARKSWQAVADSIASDSAASSEVVSSTPPTWFTAATLYPPELWKVAGPLVAGEVSFPFKTGGEFTVLQVVAIATAGKTGDFDLAADDVRDRVRVERSRAALESLLGTLRERYGVELMTNNGTYEEGTPQHDAN